VSDGMRRTAMAGAVLAALLLAGRAEAWSPGAAAVKTLAEGQAWAEVLPDSDGAAMIHGAVDIAAPPALVWAIMTDCRMAARLVKTVTRCAVLQRGPGWDVREQVTRGNLIVPTIRNVYRSDYEPLTRIRFRRIDGDLRIEEGEWRLEPIAGGAGTRVIYVNRVAARIAAPAALVREGMRRDTPKVLMNLSRECAARARG
jgi:uncharacterized protein YndB with AHSA1/START domain